MNRSRLAGTLALTALVCSVTATGPALAQATTAAPVVPALTAEAALQRAFSAQQLDPAWFSSGFRMVLPQLQAAAESFRAQYGALRGVGGSADTYRLTYERGTVTVQASLNAAGVFTSLLLLGAEASQSDPAVIRALGRLYSGADSGAALDPSWFAPAFLAQVPLAQLQAVLTQTAAGLGAFQGAAFDHGYVLNFRKGRVLVKSVALDAQGRLIGLNLEPPRGSLNSLNDVVAALRALPGQTSLMVSRLAPDGVSDVATLNPDLRLAVGSAFKLAILAEVQSQVRAGRLKWTDTATLQDIDRSLPSGTLQNEPSGSRYTLQALAEAMIGVSDNTATNLLLRTVGRAGVEARLGEAPMLDTRELFALKNPANRALLARYRATTGEARRTVIAEAATAPLPTSDNLTLDLDAEWHLSARQLCALMSEVAALPLMSLNPGVAAPADFAQVSFKGGSDGGVLNFTTQVVTRKGETYCVSATWNDTRPLDTNRLAALVQDALQLLK